MVYDEEIMFLNQSLCGKLVEILLLTETKANKSRAYYNSLIKFPVLTIYCKMQRFVVDE